MTAPAAPAEGGAMDITPDKRPNFPSGSCRAIDWPPGQRNAGTIWIDSKSLEHGQAIIRRYEAGSITEFEAHQAIWLLRYGPPARG
jgi:hypothetical protein